MVKGLLDSLRSLAVVASHPLSLVPLFVFRDRWRADFKVGQLTISARHSDLTAILETALHGEYRFINSLSFPEKALVLDLGANIGCFAAVVLSAHNDVEVHSVEPSPDTSAVLERNRRRHPEFRWYVHQMAIAEHTGAVTFSNEGPSTARRLSADRGVKVHAESFDEFIGRVARTRRVFLCKMDIEGAEVPIFAAGSTMLEQIDHLVVEVHGPSDNAQVVRAALASAFPHVQLISGRISKKPLLYAARVQPGASLLPNA
jgi:FkbM family methyltransferase